jgi:4-diphosphocytidyl-2-C-methyl-D-erythritol kinase
MCDDITTRQELDTAMLFNTFENLTFTEDNELATFRDHILKIGASHVHLAGSGPALFTMLDDRKQAEDLFIQLSQQGMEVYLTETRPESLE